jgi:hypothetical protein
MLWSELRRSDTHAVCRDELAELFAFDRQPPEPTDRRFCSPLTSMGGRLTDPRVVGRDCPR